MDKKTRKNIAMKQSFTISRKETALNEMRSIAIERKGKCLAKEYVNNHTKLSWECERGHRWEATPHNIKSNNSWCPDCSKRKKLTIEEMQKMAFERGGKCLSKEYKNMGTKLWWKCSEGHVWDATALNVKHRKSWCPTCGGRPRLTLKNMQNLAESRGGKCLSKEYERVHSRLEWQCKYGHKWPALAYTVRQGSWCPTCSTGLGERICREAFQQIFKEQFPRSYPEWLRRENNRKMELDGYCQKLGLAFEHHGKQHYTAETKFITNQKDLLDRKHLDSEKKRLCEKNGVVLFELPEIPSLLKLEDVKNTIISLCKYHNVELPLGVGSLKIDYSKAYHTNRAEEELGQLRKIALERGGKCLANGYANNKTKLLWECSKGHQWHTTPDSVKQGTWCPTCAGRPQLFLDDLRKSASEKGGKCLATEYVNGETKVVWQCGKGHQWLAKPDRIRQGTWCPECAGNKPLSIEEMHEVAKERNGKCISKSYKNMKTKLWWECELGHQWEAAPGNVIHNGSWCPKCKYLNQRKR